jgi:hypothetical protein
MRKSFATDMRILKPQKENFETLKNSKKSLHQGKRLLFSKSSDFLGSKNVQNEPRKDCSTLGYFTFFGFIGSL